MLFNSFEFIYCFLPLSLITYFLLARFQAQVSALQLSLVIFSLIFYFWNGASNGLILGFSILSNFTFGHVLNEPNLKQKSRGFILKAGVAFNLILLGIFKYLDFALENLNRIFLLDLPRVGLDLPLAISFFTFLQIAYLVDCYRNIGSGRYTFLEYGLFVLFFPHLIAGPLVHHTDLIGQLKKLRVGTQRYDNLLAGTGIFAVGLAKKVLIADSIGPLANHIFSQSEVGLLSTSTAWLGLLAYTLQIYFDFSGYSDMAIGLSKLFGVKLPENFNSPYKARNIIDFWRRWHMTLSKFLRDYLYFALGGNRKGSARRYINLMITMLLGGMWHGAGWNFLIWGGLHGFYLCINHGFKKVFPRDIPSLAPVYHLLTLFAVMVAWVFFRAGSIHSAWFMLKSMFVDHGLAPMAIDWGMRPKLAMSVGIIIAAFMPNTGEIFNLWRSDRNGRITDLLRWVPTSIWTMVVLLLCLASVFFISSEIPEFIYYKF